MRCNRVTSQLDLTEPETIEGTATRVYILFVRCAAVLRRSAPQLALSPFRGSSLRFGHHHIDLPAAAAGTDQRLAPIEHGRIGAVSRSHLGDVRVDLMPALLAPDDQSHTARGGGRQASSAGRDRA